MTPARRPPPARRAAMAALVVAASIVSAAAAAGQTLGELFRRVTPSVVLIRTKERDAQGAFSTVGSGVLVSPDGKVITAAHVVQLADSMTVEFSSGESTTARVVASEPQADVALLQLAQVPKGALVGALGDSDRVEIGDPVFIVGAPYGIGYTLTSGIISGRHKPNTIYSAMSRAEFLQTDAAINQGNSGGPMFNRRGEVIGIVSHNISKSGGFEGLGFVVTSNLAREVLLQGTPFWSGVETFMVDDDLAAAFNLPQAAGLLVQRVARGSPAERLGLRAGTIKASVGGQSFMVGGDVILVVEDITVGDPDSLERIRERMNQRRSGDEVSVTVLRDGKRVPLRAKLP